MATLSIPLTVLTVGPHGFSPAAVADTDSQVLLSIDRTVTSGNVAGFNASPATTAASLVVDQSNDGGATWRNLAAADIIGGIYTDGHGRQMDVSGVQVGFNPGTGRLVRATVTVSGASVAVAGSLVTS